MYSLKKSGYLAFVAVACLLALVMILGFRQYQLAGEYNTIIAQSEAAIFQFSTIREEITSALIEQDWNKVVAASQDLKELNSSVSRLMENSLIPAEYKLDMAKQVDLSSLALSTKNILNAQDQKALSLNLQHQIRTLADYLLRFDRIIVSQMRAKVVRFQTIMIGALGSIICIITFSLILLYQKTVLPLLNLVAQARSTDIASTGLQYNPDSCAEIAELADSINTLLEGGCAPPSDIGLHHNEQLTAIINEGTNLSNGIINYAQLLSDSCQEGSAEDRSLLTRIIADGERIAGIFKKI